MKNSVAIWCKENFLAKNPDRAACNFVYALGTPTGTYIIGNIAVKCPRILANLYLFCRVRNLTFRHQIVQQYQVIFRPKWFHGLLTFLILNIFQIYLPRRLHLGHDQKCRSPKVTTKHRGIKQSHSSFVYTAETTFIRLFDDQLGTSNVWTISLTKEMLAILNGAVLLPKSELSASDKSFAQLFLNGKASSSSSVQSFPCTTVALIVLETSLERFVTIGFYSFVLIELLIRVLVRKWY